MAITVTVIEDPKTPTTVNFPTGDSFLVDPQNRLIVKDANDNQVGMFSAGAWQHVVKT